MLKNCDEIFEKYDVFAACRKGEEEVVDPSVYVFTPSLEQCRALEKVVHYVNIDNGRARGWTKYLKNKYIQILNISKIFLIDLIF